MQACDIGATDNFNLASHVVKASFDAIMHFQSVRDASKDVGLMIVSIILSP